MAQEFGLKTLGISPKNALEQLQMQKIISAADANPAMNKAYKQYRKATKGASRWSKDAWALLNYEAFQQADTRQSAPHLQSSDLMRRLPNMGQ